MSDLIGVQRVFFDQADLVIEVCTQRALNGAISPVYVCLHPVMAPYSAAGTVPQHLAFRRSASTPDGETQASYVLRMVSEALVEVESGAATPLSQYQNVALEDIPALQETYFLSPDLSILRRVPRSITTLLIKPPHFR